MVNAFNIPSVDHLIEGVHYRLVDWSFAEGQESIREQATNMPSRGMPSTFAEECEKDERMIYGKCRKTKKDGDWDSSKKTKGEEEGEAEAKKQSSNFQNNKKIDDVKSGKKLGWAMKDGKPVLVEWGSVAGEKKVGPRQPAAKPQAGAKPKEEKKKEDILDHSEGLFDFRRCVRPDGSAYGTSGNCRKGNEQEKSQLPERTAAALLGAAEEFDWETDPAFENIHNWVVDVYLGDAPFDAETAYEALADGLNEKFPKLKLTGEELGELDEEDEEILSQLESYTDGNYGALPERDEDSDFSESAFDFTR